MDSAEESPNNENVRRTRSGKIVPTPPAPKPVGKKTRKKVILMEVEVSDDEEETNQTNLEKGDEETNEAVTPNETSNELLETKNDHSDVSLEVSEAKHVEKNVSDNKDNNDLSELLDSSDNIAAGIKMDVSEIKTVPEEDVLSSKQEDSTDAFKSSEDFLNDEIVDNVEEAMEEDILNDVEGPKPDALEENDVSMEEVPSAEESPKSDSEVVKPDSKPFIRPSIEDVKTDPEVVKSHTKPFTGPSIEDVKTDPEVVKSPTKPFIGPSVEDVKTDPEVVKSHTKPFIGPSIEDVKTDPEVAKSPTKPFIGPSIEDVKTDPEVVKSHSKSFIGPLMEGVKTDPEVSTKPDSEKIIKPDQEERTKKDSEASVDSESSTKVQIEKIRTNDDSESNGGIKQKNGLEALRDIRSSTEDNMTGEPDAENISEDELPLVQPVKVPETEEVSDEELPGPKRAELPADTEVVSEDELMPSVKKEGTKRKIEDDYDPTSPTSESEVPTKKPALDISVAKEEEKPAKPKKLPELDKYWKAVNDDPTDFTGWTYLLQYVDQENDMEAAREAYDAFLSHYPYCYGYWRKYADYEKRKGNKKKCEEVFERGLKAIPLSVDLWIHYLTYVKTSKPDDEDYIRSQFERAIQASGLEFRSDRLWDSYIKWETEAKRLQQVTTIYDRLFTTPTQGYTTHFENFQEHIQSNPPNKVVEVDEFLALRKEVRHMLKHDVTTESNTDNSDAPPGEDDSSKIISTDEETKAIRERIISIRRKIHKNTVTAVTARWNYEEAIKRPYFHVKPLERCQLKNWQEYLDYEIEQGDQVRIVVLFERCLIACALYEEFWLKFVHYLENLKDPELQPKIRDVYERACTIHHLKKPSLHLQWAMFEEYVENFNRAAEILSNLEKSVPNVLQIAYRKINLERRRSDYEKCSQLYEHYINNSKNKMISSNIAIKYSRFTHRLQKNIDKAIEILKTAITKDPINPRLYLQLIDVTLQKESVLESEVVELIDSFLEKDSADADQKVLFAQRKLEYLEDFGANIQSVQKAYDDYQKYIKQSKENAKKKESKSESSSSGKKDKASSQPTSQSGSYGNYGNYGNTAAQGSYQYSGSQPGQYGYTYGQGDQYQYQGWQYPQGGYGGYNQWGSYGGGYSY